MNILLTCAGLAVAFTALAGCVEDTGNSADGLKGGPDDFAAMHKPCRHQAANMTGVQLKKIHVTDEIRTGGGPLLTLSVNGVPYSCRREAGGNVTVFSEYAN